MAAKAGAARRSRTRRSTYDDVAAGVRRLRLRRLAPAASARSTSSASPASRCSTSTTTARPARPRCMLGAQAVEGGMAECVLVVGFEQMEKGALGVEVRPIARTRSSKHVDVMNEVQGFNQAPPAAQMFGGAGREYRWKYGTKRETFAQDRREGAQARVEEPVRAVQGDALASRRSWPRPRSSIR